MYFKFQKKLKVAMYVSDLNIVQRLLDMLEPLVDDYAHDSVDAQGHELDSEVAQFWHLVSLCIIHNHITSH